MPDAAVYVVPDANFDDWIVRTDAGDEVAHYATREAAELVAQQIAHERAIDLVVHLPDGRTTRKRFAKGWVSKLFGDHSDSRWPRGLRENRRQRMQRPH